MRYIPEMEFNEDYERTLRELARSIAFSGLTIAEIAKGTRMKWSTVYNASQGIAVRMESACRIRYYLKQNNFLKHNEKRE